MNHNTQKTPRKSKRNYIVGGVLAVVLLFMGATLWNAPHSPSDPQESSLIQDDLLSAQVNDPEEMMEAPDGQVIPVSEVETELIPELEADNASAPGDHMEATAPPEPEPPAAPLDAETQALMREQAGDSAVWQNEAAPLAGADEGDEGEQTTPSAQPAAVESSTPEPEPIPTQEGETGRTEPEPSPQPVEEETGEPEPGPSSTQAEPAEPPSLPAEQTPALSPAETFSPASAIVQSVFPGPQEHPVALQIEQEGAAYLRLPEGTAVFSEDTLPDDNRMGTLGEGIALAIGFVEENEEHDAAVLIVFYEGQEEVEGFIKADEDTLLLYDAVIQDIISMEPPTYYGGDEHWPLPQISYTPVQTKPSPSPAAAASFAPEALPEAETPSFYRVRALDASGEILSLYSLQTNDGQILYRLYGIADGGEPGFYACDASGALLLPAQRVDLEADAMLAMIRHEIVGFVEVADPSAPIASMEVGLTGFSAKELPLPKTLTAILDDGSTLEIPVAWVLPARELLSPAQQAQADEAQSQEGLQGRAADIDQAIAAAPLPLADAGQALEEKLLSGGEADLEAQWDSTTLPLAQGVQAPFITLRGGPDVGTLTLACDTLAEDQTEYDLSTDMDTKITLRYQAPASNTKDTILVVHAPAYGGGFRNKPGENNYVQSSLIYNSNQSIAVALKDGLDGEIIIEVQMSSDNSAKRFSLAQGLQWMDEGILPPTGIRAEVYEGTLSESGVEGVSQSSVQYGNMSPTNYDFDPDFFQNYNYTYKQQVSSIGVLTNAILSMNQQDTTSSSFFDYGLRYPVIEYKQNSVHYQKTPLMEITGVKLYAPDERLYLKEVRNTQQRLPSSNRWPTGWNISQRQQDEKGFYYILTPTQDTRLINVDPTRSFFQDYIGFFPVWQLLDTAAELDHLPDAYTEYQAAETEVTIRIPVGRENDAPKYEEHIITHTGPYIRVMARQEEECLQIIPYPARKKENAVTIVPGESLKWQEQSSIFNSYYVSRNSAIRTEYTPAYPSGPITENYEFPYEIRPTRVLFNRLVSSYKDEAGNSLDNFQAALEGIAYTTQDGVLHQVPKEDIDKVNLYLSNRGGLMSADFLQATQDNYVTSVAVTWQKVWRGYTPQEISAPRENAGAYSVRTSFNFDTTTHKEDGTEIEEGYMARIGLSVDATDHPDKNFADPQEQYLWYRFKPKVILCPTGSVRGLFSYYSGRYLTDNIMQGDGKSDYTIGDVNLTPDAKAPLALLENPVITLSANVTTPAGAAGYGIDGMTDAQGLCFLSGKFSVSKEFNGWDVVYTTNRRTDPQTFPLSSGSSSLISVNLGIDLNGGEYLTSLALSYTGSFDMSAFTSGRPVFTDIMIRAWDHNPVTGEAIVPRSNGEFGAYGISLNAFFHWDNCVCADHKHLSVPGTQAGIEPSATEMSRLFYLRRSMTIQGSASRPTPIADAYQGTATGRISLNVSIDFPGGIVFLPGVGAFSNGSSTYYAPWDVAEAVYIELTDPEFSIDMSRVQLFTLPIGEDVQGEIVNTPDGRRFLRLAMVDSGRRQKFNISGKQWNFGQNKSIGSSYGAGGYIDLFFNVIPGARPGIHTPIGDVYVDISTLLDDYNVPGVSKDGLTNYEFQGAVEDPYGFASGKSEENKLFLSTTANDFTVNVLLASRLGVELTPGQNGSYEFTTREVGFHWRQRDELEALVSFTAPGDKVVEDYTAYVALPRKGQTVTATDANMQPLSATSEYDMYLRGVPVLVSDSSQSAGGAAYAYTTAQNPGASSAYDFTPASDADWARVTGVKIVVEELSKSSAVNVSLPLTAGNPAVKQSGDSSYAYIAGSYTYLTGGATLFTGGLQIGKYTYGQYVVTQADTCRVFFDTADEDGTHGGSDRAAKKDEVRLTLYDSDYDPDTGTGTVIDSVTTGSGGYFALLHSYKDEAGLVLKIDAPQTGADSGAVWKLTRQSGDALDASVKDSDFDRDTNALTLPEIPEGGFKNISAGFIRLPDISAPDITLNLGETRQQSITLTRYFSAGKPEDEAAYNLTVTAAEDANIASVTAGETTLAFAQGADEKTIEVPVTGLLSGQTKATVTTRNRLGDIVTVTFNITVEGSAQSEIIATKTWEDNKNALGVRPDSAAIQLYRQIAGGAREAVGTEAQITGDSAAEAWTYTFGPQDDRDAQGKVYEYTIEEVAVHPGYVSAQSGLTLTNTLQTTKVPGAKVWDTTLGDGFDMPRSVHITLLRNGAEYAALDVSDDGDGDNTWPFAFEKLPTHDKTGKAFVYTVDETTAVAGTSKSISGTTVTNAYIGDAEIKVTSTWNYTGAPKDQRPDTVTAKLQKDGTDYLQADIQGQGAVQSFSIPQKHTGGTFTLDTVPVDSYRTDVVENSDGSFAMTHTFIMPTKDISGTKTWAGNLAGITPPPVKLSLWQNGQGGKAYQTQTLPGGEKDYTFKAVPLYDANGDEYTYIVTEDSLPGYTGDASGYDFTNTYAPDAAKVTVTALKEVTKVGTAFAPDVAFTFTLTGSAGTPMPAGSQGQVRTVQAKAGAIAFGEIVFTHPGVYTYTLAEVPAAPAAEGMDYDDAAFTLTVTVTDTAGALTASPVYSKAGESGAASPTFRNTYTLPTRDVKVALAWADGGNAQGVRPDGALVQLERTPQGGGKEDVPAAQGGQRQITGDAKADAWETTFANMPAHDEAGNAYTYTAREISPSPNYETKAEGLAITDTLQTQALTLTKHWNILGDGFTKEAVTFDLYRKTSSDGDFIKASEHTLTGDEDSDTWTLEVPGLLSYDKEGNAYTYEALEPSPPFATIPEEDGLEITNTYGANARITVRKSWDYTGAPQDRRPAASTIRLLRNGKPYAEKTLEGNADYTFEIPQVDYLNATFTLEEDAVAGYAVTRAQAADGAEVFANTFIMPKSKVSGTKVWKNLPATVTPPTVTLRLHQNGKETDTQALIYPQTAYAFSGLDEFDPEGAAYAYTVSEDAVPGYDSAQNGLDFINTYNPTKAVLSVTAGKTVDFKGWAPEEEFTFTLAAQEKNAPMPTGSQDGIKTIQAKAGAVVFGEITFNAPGTYVYEIAETTPDTRTPGMDYDDTVYVMTVDVTLTDGVLTPSAAYAARGGEAAKGIAFTNRYTVPSQDVIVIHTWADDHDARGVRPDRITLQLQRAVPGGVPQDVAGGAQALTGGQGAEIWQSVFAGMPAHDDSGRPYAYSARIVDPSPNYTVQADGLSLTSTLSTESRVIAKAWKIQGSGFDKPAASIELWRTGGGEAETRVGTYDVNGDEDSDTWTYEVQGLLGYSKAGIAYGYEAREPNPPFATTGKVSGLTVTNTYGPDARVSVQTIWDHTGAPVDQRLEEATIILLRDGKEYARQQLTGNTSYVFEIPQVDYQGAAFTAEEAPVDGYVSAMTQDTDGVYVFTNRYQMPLDTVSGSKHWAGELDGITVPTATLRLLQNGVPIDSTTLSETKTTYEFTGLPRYDAAGAPYAYTVAEDSLEGFTLTLDSTGRNLTNTYAPKAAKLRILGQKGIPSDTWAPRDTAFVFTLTGEGDAPMPAGSQGGTYTLKAPEGALDFGEITFTENGVYTYTLREEPPTAAGFTVDGAVYTLTVTVSDPQSNGVLVASAAYEKDGQPAKAILLENTYAVPTTDLTAQKVWEDFGDAYGLRPQTAHIILRRSTSAAQEANAPVVQSATLDASGGWAYAFTGLPVHDEGGNPYTYFVTEADTDSSYTPKAAGMTLTNTLREGAISGRKELAPAPSIAGDVPVARAGDRITYGILITNESRRVVTHVRVMDILPDGVTLEAGGTTPGASFTENGVTTLMWEIPEIGVGKTFEIKVQATINQPAEGEGAHLIANQAYYRIAPPEEIAFPPDTPDSPDDYQQTPPDGSRFQMISYTAGSDPAGGGAEASATPLRQGQKITFTHTLDAAAQIRNVRMLDTLSEGFALVPGSIRVLHPDGREQRVPDDALTSGALTWPAIDVKPGETRFVYEMVAEKLPDGDLERVDMREASITLDDGMGAEIGEAAPPAYYKTLGGYAEMRKDAALVGSDGEPRPIQNGTAAAPAEIPRGGQVEYTITVHYTAAQGAHSGRLVVEDALPAGMALVSDSIKADIDGTQGRIISSEASKDGMRWTLEGLADGEIATLSFRASAPYVLNESSTSGWLDFANTARLTDEQMRSASYEAPVPGHAQGSPLFTPGEYEKTSGATYHRAYYPSLTIQKSADVQDGSRVAGGQRIVYTFALKNDAKVSGGPLVVRDLVPMGMRCEEDSIASTLPGTQMRLRQMDGQEYVCWIVPEIAAQSEGVLSAIFEVQPMDGIGIRRFANTAEYRQVPAGGDPQRLLEEPAGFESSNEVRLFQSVGGSVRVIKVDANTGEGLPGAEFTLTQLSAREPEGSWSGEVTGTTDENGEISFDDVPLGEYVLAETEPPEGYLLNTIRRSVNLDAEQTERTVRIANRLANGALLLLEQDLSGVGSRGMGINPD